MEQAAQYRKAFVGQVMKSEEKRVVIVSGAPGSGKTYYVKSHLQPGDLALDFDYLTAALALDDRLYGDREPQLHVALAAREAIFDTISKREGNWNTAYIITARKEPARVQELADRLGGEIVRMSATLEECRENIRNDPRRAERIDRYFQLAEEWYQQNGTAQQ
ncbi:MAG: ATP-binding protein [Oscillospiraceae bacterium]|nr:ATP-binding protein [Oscillospiraceae bacterium]